MESLQRERLRFTQPTRQGGSRESLYQECQWIKRVIKNKLR